MPSLSADKAIERLASRIEDELDPDELLEVYNELFDDVSYTSEEVHDDPLQITERLVGHLNSGLGPEEILQLWNLVYPGDWHVWYDEEKSVYDYNEEKPQTVD